jgi:hypothetical protein
MYSWMYFGLRFDLSDYPDDKIKLFFSLKY